MSPFLESASPPCWFDAATDQVDILVNFELPSEAVKGDSDVSLLLAAIKRHRNPRDYAKYLPTNGMGKKSRNRFFKQRHQTAVKNQSEEPATLSVSRTSLRHLLEFLPDKVFLEEVLNLASGKGVGCASPVVQLGSVKVSRAAPLAVAGRYVKLCRDLPQTPWVLDGERKLDSSVEELIASPLVSAFGPDTTYNFVSSGREDVDVRCLGLGRPFVLELNGFNRTLYSMLRTNSALPDENAALKNRTDAAIFEDANNLTWLTDIVNKSTDNRVFVRDLQIVRAAAANASLKSGEIEKLKRYRAVCWCSEGGLTTERVRRIDSQIRAMSCDSGEASTPSKAEWPPTKVAHHPELKCDMASLSLGGFTINQLTPIRVLHRRALMSRSREITWIRLADFTSSVLCENAPFALKDFTKWTEVYPKEELFLLELCCEAGTYVKELVHGDLGRTQPNLSSLLGCQVDLLALDVIAVEHDWPPQISQQNN
ncbi:unnamed protein product [Mesocestoides corti]|uniref:tRNA pseudouridine(55) synthase n=1 Tax=Mesocestoides corti TaxID=53468 RepID=A0A0R3UPS3_MESCO|nr:unnamed protein product [Mesocestoides corti]